jgi:hypothetical protein
MAMLCQYYEGLPDEHMLPVGVKASLQSTDRMRCLDFRVFRRALGPIAGTR